MYLAVGPIGDRPCGRFPTVRTLGTSEIFASAMRLIGGGVERSSGAIAGEVAVEITQQFLPVQRIGIAADEEVLP